MDAFENQVSKIAVTRTRELQGAFCLHENAGDVLLQRTMADNEEEKEFQVACASSLQSAPMKSLAEERILREGLQRSSTFRSPADQPAAQGYAEDEAREGYFASQNIDAAHAFLRSISQRGDCIQYTTDREGSRAGRAYETGSPVIPKEQVHEQFRTPAAFENFEHADGGSQPTIIFDSQEESHQAKLPGFMSPELPIMQKQGLSMRSSIQQGLYAKQANPSQHVGIPSQSAFNFESRSTSPFQASITSSVAEQSASLHGRFFQDGHRTSSNATNLSKSIPLIRPTPAIQASTVSLRSTELDTLEHEAAQNLQQCMILKQRLEIRTAIMRNQLEEANQERQRNEFELGIANRQVQEITGLRNKHVYQPSNFPSNIPSSFEKSSRIPPAWPHIEDVRKNLGFHEENCQQGRSDEPHPLEAMASNIVLARSRQEADVNTEQKRDPANVFSRQAMSLEYPQRHAAFKGREEEGGELLKQDRKVTDVTESDERRRSVLESTVQKEDPKRQGSELGKVVEESVFTAGGAEGDFEGPESSVKQQNEAGETRQETMLSDERHSSIANAKEKGTQKEELKHEMLSENPQGRQYVISHGRSEVHSGRTEADESQDRAHMADRRAFRTSSREEGVRGEARAGDGAGQTHENLAKGREEMGRGYHGSRSEEKVSQLQP